MTTALIASDWFVIPVFPSGYDLKGLETLARTVEKVRNRYNPTLRLAGVLPEISTKRPNSRRTFIEHSLISLVRTWFFARPSLGA